LKSNITTCSVLHTSQTFAGKRVEKKRAKKRKKGKGEEGKRTTSTSTLIVYSWLRHCPQHKAAAENVMLVKHVVGRGAM